MGLYTGGTGTLLSMFDPTGKMGLAPADYVGRLNLNERSSAGTQKKLEAYEASSSIYAIAPWMSLVWAQGWDKYEKRNMGQAGDDLHTAQVDHWDKQRRAALAYGENTSMWGNQAAKSLLNLAFKKLLYTPSSVARQRLRKDRGEEVEGVQTNLRKWSKELQKYYMYIIKIRVGIIYQLRMNIAILKLIRRCFLRPDGEVTDINESQIERVNQLVNFYQPVIGGPGAAWSQVQQQNFWGDDVAIFDNVIKGGETNPFLKNNKVWDECKEQDKPTTLSGQLTCAGTTVWKRLLPGICNLTQGGEVPQTQAEVSAAAPAAKKKSRRVHNATRNHHCIDAKARDGAY